MFSHANPLVVQIPYKAKLFYDGAHVSFVGPKVFTDRILKLKSLYGNDPKLWQEQSVQDGYDILINEFILKINNKFGFCYKHDELCHCRNVATEKVYLAIKDNAFSVEAVSRATLAGTGCGSCKKDIEDLLHQFKKSV